MSAQRLADRTAELGFPVPRSVLANLESGRRETLGVHELFVLAEALGLPPLLLVFPVGHVADVEVVPGLRIDPLSGLDWAGARYIAPPRQGGDREYADEQRTINRHDQHRSAVTRWAFNRRKAAELADGADGESAERRQHHEGEAKAAAELLAYLRSEMRAHGEVLPELPPDLVGEVDTYTDIGSSLSTQAWAQRLLEGRGVL